MLRGLWLGVALLLAGCGGAEETDPDPVTHLVSEAGAPTEMAAAPACEPGRVAACPCAGGTMGTQACADDGSKWGTCACPALAPEATDPTVACLQKYIQSEVIGQCAEPRPIVWGRCDKAIVESGVCIKSRDGGLFCCPT